MADKIKAKLSNLDASLSDLESQLELIFSQSLPETIIGLEPIQQAKLQTVLPYLVYDLVFIYLKAKGVDPKTHAVVAELDRVRQYFDKIAKAENPPIRRAEVDKDAAERFIKHAISGITSMPSTATPVDVSSQSILLPVKTTTKMIARAQYERTLEKERHENNDDEDELQVYDGHGSDSSASDEGDIYPLTESITEDISTSSKRQRPPVHPSAGYGKESPQPSKKNKRDSADSDSVAASSGPENRRGKKKKRAKKPQL